MLCVVIILRRRMGLRFLNLRNMIISFIILIIMFRLLLVIVLLLLDIVAIMHDTRIVLRIMFICRLRLMLDNIAVVKTISVVYIYIHESSYDVHLTSYS